jgi:hypothetical protein
MSIKHINHTIIEYIIHIIGNILSIIFCILLFVMYTNGLVGQFSLYSAISVWMYYIILSAYLFIFIFSPIYGIFNSRAYLLCFTILFITSSFWLYKFFETREFIQIVNAFLVLSPLPISYILAWRVNATYWKKSKRPV